MNKRTTLSLSGALFALTLTGPAFAAASASHLHMGHVTDGWNDTPDGKGLLPIAIAEARIALQHASATAGKPDDLAWMKMHARHVLHALDPSVEAQGPGLGYGVAKAAAGTAKHIEAAAASDDASGNVKTHAVHVASAARNTVGRAGAMVEAARQILSADSAASAAPAAQQLRRTAEALLDGVDANGDGKVTWHAGEGGLLEADKHMMAMRRGEGL